VNDLVERLPQFNWVGVGRNDGQTQGEFAAICYGTCCCIRGGWSRAFRRGTG